MKTIEQTIQDLALLIKAGYPILYLVSFEEARVERILRQAAAISDRQLFFWDRIEGLVGDQVRLNDTEEPFKAISEISSRVENDVIIMRDLHWYFNDPMVIRALRSATTQLRSNHSTIAIVAPRLVLPVELEKDITVVDIPLPAAGEMRTQAEMILGADDSWAAPAEEDIHRIADAALGMTEDESGRAFSKLKAAGRGFGDEAVEMVIDEKQQVIRKTRMLTFIDPTVGMSDVGGMEELKKWLENRRDAFGDKARAFGLPAPKGLMVLGVQGCGKSLVSKAMMKLWRLPLLLLDMGAIFGNPERGPEESIAAAMKTAETLAPCLLWIDEIEKGFAGMSGSDRSGAEGRMFSSFLTWMQEKKSPVFVVATANSIENLPPELLRKGRFDEIFFVDLPADGEREEIFRIHLKKRGRDPEKFAIDSFVEISRGYSGAEIEESIISALFYAFGEGRDLTDADITKSLKETVPLWETSRETIDHLKDWAEKRARFASWGVRKGDLDFSLSKDLVD